MTILARLVNHDMLCGFERPRGAGGAGSASTVGLDRAGTGTEQHPMTNQHTQRKRTVTGIALAALLFSGMLVFNGVLAAQTAEEPQVVFRVRMVQAERAATDKLAAERVTLSKADFSSSETINVHILNEACVSPLSLGSFGAPRGIHESPAWSSLVV